MALRSSGGGCWSLPLARNAKSVTAAAESRRWYHKPRYQCQLKQKKVQQRIQAAAPSVTAWDKPATRRRGKMDLWSQQLMHTSAISREQSAREAEITEAVAKLAGLLESDSDLSHSIDSTQQLDSAGSKDDELVENGDNGVHETSHPMWRPAALHYNIALDVICRDPSSTVDELISLHRDMRLHSIQEDAVTFNTLLNGCRRIHAWKYFRVIDQQLRKRDEWGVTRMDATTWGTLIQGYKECMDWSAVDSCVAQASAASHEWHKSQGAPGPGTHAVKPTAELWSTIVNVYAVRDMVPQMIASRQVMHALDLPMSLYTFAPMFAALHRFRKHLIRDQKDAWPAITLALEELEAMRQCGVTPNATVLTNVMLTLALENPYGANNQAEDGSRGQCDKVSSVGGSIARELEAMLVRARDPNIYAALFNTNGRARSLDDVKSIWQTLETESQFTHDDSAQPLLSSLTLAAYMHALINCKAYDDAIAAFYKYAAPTQPSKDTQPGSRGHLASVTLKNVDRSVYEASIRAFALADRHRMCPQVIRKMINSGIEPSVFALRYMLLAPDQAYSKRKHQHKYTRRWSLPLAVAREAWDMILGIRREKWMNGPLLRDEPHSIDAGMSGSAKLGKRSHSSAGELPVIVNDIAAQYIRIAAYARSVQFGEQVFEALESEAEYFGIGHEHRAKERASTHTSDTYESSGDAGLESGADSGYSRGHSRFPDDLQCAPNVRTYTSMITMYGNDANLAGVSKMWASMLRDGVEPNLMTYTSLISALHKVALRKRWKRTQTYSEMAASGSKFAMDSRTKADSEEQGPKDANGTGELWWGSTKQDNMISQIEDHILGGVPKRDGREHAASMYASQQLQLFGDGRSPGLDIPLSTLLLRYHSVRIRDTIRDVPKDSSNGAATYVDRDTAEDIKRAMRVCQAVEDSGLEPDYRFHSALADFFETCGDSSGAELHMPTMSSRYSKVLTWHNAQLFAGGFMLTGTVGYIWLKPRMERTQELQDHLHQVQQHMYWSMSLTQRGDLPPKHGQALYNRSRRRWLEGANSWWNNKVFGFNRWVMEPGYVTQEARRMQRLVGQGAAEEWVKARRLARGGMEWTGDWVKDAVHWNEAMEKVGRMWEGERSKWSLAHANAIEAVHPRYKENESEERDNSRGAKRR
ncbi:hypothetical protein GQ54DRAFT_307014 [Martensiomyces pterosporus]|nr:hypothetical protein GQ54DRAFT_307014 [Martensiomyces pterosporus]